MGARAQKPRLTNRCKISATWLMLDDHIVIHLTFGIVPPPRRLCMTAVAGAALEVYQQQGENATVEIRQGSIGVDVYVRFAEMPEYNERKKSRKRRKVHRGWPRTGATPIL